MKDHSESSLKNEARLCRDIAERLNRRADIIEELLDQEISTLLSPLSETARTHSLESNGTQESEIIRFKRVAGSKMSQAEACALVLERSELPMTTEQILEQIKSTGIVMNMPKKHNHLAPVLSRKGDVFKNISRGKWTLVKRTKAA